MSLEMARLAAKVTRLELELAEAKQQLHVTKNKPWNPKSGDFMVSTGGRVYEVDPTVDKINFGTIRPTRAEAERAASRMRLHNRLLAYVDEKTGGYSFTKNKDNYVVYYDHETSEWKEMVLLHMEILGVVYMPKQTAKVLIEQLKHGDVML